MGVKPFLVASSIQAVMAQRLIRVLCKECKAIDPEPDPKYLDALRPDEPTPGEAIGKAMKAVGLRRLQLQHRIPRASGASSR